MILEVRIAIVFTFAEKGDNAQEGTRQGLLGCCCLSRGLRSDSIGGGFFVNIH